MNDTKLIIIGPYDKDENFTYVYSCDVMYILANYSREWGYVKVGDRMDNGYILTQVMFDTLHDNATYKSDTFEINESYEFINDKKEEDNDIRNFGCCTYLG